MLKRPDGHNEANILLSLLPDDVRHDVMSVCRPVKLNLGDMLISAGAPIERVFSIIRHSLHCCGFQIGA